MRLAIILVITAVVVLLAGGITFWDRPGRDISEPEIAAAETRQVSAATSSGASLFEANCAACHGTEGQGTNQGPPLVHKIYEPSHHADIAFQLAAQNGVRAHHWNFGNMPPVQGISANEMAEIVAYVRSLQQDAGIY